MKQLSRIKKSLRPIKVLQFGGGNFLRAYFDWMVDVLNEETNFNGDVLIVKPTQRGDYKSLRAQDGLYHVRTKGIQDGELVFEVDLIECVQKIIHPYKEWDAFLESAHLDSIKIIVSNTTEAGIKFSEETLLNDQPPNEFPAKLAAWLYERWKYFNGAADKGTVIIPLELIENNGQLLKACILHFVNHWGLPDEFKSWIQNHNTFCDTLVDRIVTGFPKSDIHEVYKSLNCKDELVVDTEPYHLFVIKGPELVKQTLPLHQTNLNVIFTDDISRYRDIKVRILNGAHTSMVPMGLINGVQTVDAFMKNEILCSWLKDLIINEIIPTLDYPKDQLKKYYQDVLDRFRNPFIVHKLRDISLNSISKFKTRVLPSLLINHKTNTLYHSKILESFAALIAFYLSESSKTPIQLRDNEEIINSFNTLSKREYITKEDFEIILNEILSNQEYWEQDLSKLDGLNSSLAEAFSRIYKFSKDSLSTGSDYNRNLN